MHNVHPVKTIRLPQVLLFFTLYTFNQRLALNMVQPTAWFSSVSVTSYNHKIVRCCLCFLDEGYQNRCSATTGYPCRVPPCIVLVKGIRSNSKVMIQLVYTAYSLMIFRIQIVAPYRVLSCRSKVPSIVF